MAECFWCEGTGKFKKPVDDERFDDAFEKYDSTGVFTMGECREKALKDAGYILVKCEHCNGTGILKE